MNKREFAKIYMKINKHDITLKQAIQEIDCFLETVKEALIRDGKIKFVRRGTFDIFEKKSKIVSNPTTRELMKIYPPKTVRFRASKNIYN